MEEKLSQLLFFVNFLLIVNLLGVPVMAQDALVKHPVAHENAGFLDFNGYYDLRKFSVLTINMLAKLPHRFQYFSLTNYQGAHNTTDVGQFYSEQNVRWNLKKDYFVDVTAQWVMRNVMQHQIHE